MIVAFPDDEGFTVIPLGPRAHVFCHRVVRCSNRDDNVPANEDNQSHGSSTPQLPLQCGCPTH